MNLKELLKLSSDREYKKQGISEQRLLKDITGLRKLIAYFRQYPDIFVDYKNSLKHMKEHDDNLDEQLIEEEYKNRRVKHE